MFARAVFAFLACPGIVALAAPVAWLAYESRLQLRWPPGLALLSAGLAGLLWCVRDFYVAGKGTLAPWSPPERLVVVGLYRCSRNPMYVCVIVILLGWALAFGSSGLLLYAAIVATAFHLRVVFGEEPWLGAKFGAQWQDYSRRVGRWLSWTQAGRR
jgi:protein-S-isoprenylcysteine O-methyltransferase Ste14